VTEVETLSRDKRPIGFDDPDFSQLCSLIHDVRALQRGDWSVRGRVLRALRRPVALLRSVARLPSETLYLSDAPTGQRIRGQLPRRLVDARRVVAISTLTLPATFEEYRRGPSRQAFPDELRQGPRVRCQRRPGRRRRAEPPARA
jgi:hypothetical protein